MVTGIGRNQQNHKLETQRFHNLNNARNESKGNCARKSSDLLCGGVGDLFWKLWESTRSGEIKVVINQTLT